MRGSRLIILALAGILFFTAGPSLALTGLGFGLRAGTTKLEDPNTDESLDAMTMFGGHVKVGTLPIVDFEGSLEYAQKKKNINVVGPQLTKALFQSTTQICMAIDEVIGSRSHYISFPIASKNIAHDAHHLRIDSKTKEEVYAFIQCLVDGLFAWSICS